MPVSRLVSLRGSSSGGTYDADRLPHLDPADERPLPATFDLDAAARTLTPASLRERPRGMWRWTELLPVRDPDAIGRDQCVVPRAGDDDAGRGHGRLRGALIA